MIAALHDNVGIALCIDRGILRQLGERARATTRRSTATHRPGHWSTYPLGVPEHLTGASIEVLSHVQHVCAITGECVAPVFCTLSTDVSPA